MQLRERHQLEVTDRVCKYINPCPASWSAITLRDLLSHTSGIPNFTDDADFKRTDVLPRTVEQLIAIFREKPLEFAPGTSWKYSNSGYVLLGAIIERVTNKRYEEVLREQILQPLGMDDSGYDHHEPVIAHRASGYVISKGVILNAPYVETSWAYAAGAMYSTILDLYRWDQALYSNKVLPQWALKEMWTPVREMYGYGWGIVQSGATARKHLELTHDGGVDGFGAHISRFPEDGTVVIVLANIETPPAPLAAIGIALAAIVFGEPYLHLVEADKTVNVSMFDRYLGDYDVGDNNIVRIKRIGDELHVQILDAPDQPTFLATPLSRTRLLVDDLGGIFEFSGGHEASIIAKAPGEKQRVGHRISAREEKR